jgi:hypothetical protein
VATFLHQLGFLAAAAALAAAGVRVASVATSRGLERFLAATVLATSAAVTWALVLGLLGAGSNTVALLVSALLTWLICQSLFPRPRVGVLAELRSIAETSGRPGRALVGALAGVIAASAAFFLIHPGPDIDSLAYHLPEALAWVHSGHPGSVVQPAPAFQTGFYPLAHEVVLAWGLSLSRSFVPVGLWQPLILGVAIASVWLGLRRLGVGRLATGLTAAAIVASPPFAVELNTALNDNVAVAWLLATAALTLAAGRERPRLFSIALLAGALSVGAKPITVPFVVLVLALGALRLRRLEAAPLLTAGAMAFAVGVFWYVRDLVIHGSPFWPEVSAPWGDPLPALARRMHASFLGRLSVSVNGRVSQYASVVAGNLVLIGGGTLAWILARSRQALLASAVCALGALLWANSPSTGVPQNRALDLSVSTTRYLLPVAAAGALALALATRRRGMAGRIALLLLAGAFVWSLLSSASRQAPALPGLDFAAAGLAGGALVGGLLDRWVLRRVAVLIGGVLAGLALALAADGYVSRSAQAPGTFGGPVLGWLTRQPSYENSGGRIAIGPQQDALLAGEHLQHPVQLIGVSESCRRIHERARRGWLVLRIIDPAFFPLLGYSPAQFCLARDRPAFAAGDFRVFRDQ